MANTTCFVILLSIISINNVISSPISDGCKKTSLTKNHMIEPMWRMDDSALKHVTLQKNASGITHFEMHLAVKSQDLVDIVLSSHFDQFDKLKEDFYIIQFGSNISALYQMKEIVTMRFTDTPDLLSWTHFTPLYVKIINESLEFGIQVQPAYLSYTAANVKTMKYFTFGTANTDISKMTELYFDCP